MEVKRMFGLLGFVIVATLSSTILIKCVMEDARIISSEIKKFNKEN